MIGKDDTSDCGVLKELVGQFQIEEVCVPLIARSLTGNLIWRTPIMGSFTTAVCQGAAAARGIANAEGRRLIEHRGLNMSSGAGARSHFSAKA